MVSGGKCKNFFEFFSNFFAYLGSNQVRPAFCGVMGDFCRFAPASKRAISPLFSPDAPPNLCPAAALSPLLAPSVSHRRDAIDVGQRSWAGVPDVVDRVRRYVAYLALPDLDAIRLLFADEQLASALQEYKDLLVLLGAVLPAGLARL